MADRPATIYPPGEHLREEIEARGWTQVDFSRILDRPEKVVNEIINGKRAITPETAHEIADALGTSPHLWLNLESAYRLANVSRPVGHSPIAQRAALYEKAPVNELIRRHWIKQTKDIQELERSVLDFFRAKSLGETFLPPLAAARTGTTATTTFSVPQVAWLRRVEQLAPTVTAGQFKLDRFRSNLPALRELARHPEQIREVPRALAELGVRMLIVEHLKGTRFDGGCIWLRPDMPVVALSLRYDRIDCFWHTLIHECAHVYHEDQLPSIDEGVEDSGGDEPEIERRANEFASNLLIPRGELDDFIVRAGPNFGLERVLGFAARIRIHPGIVVGQLQHRTKRYTFHRKQLVKIRSFIVRKTATDGWDNVRAA